MFRKILIANRGEIALRVICACKELGIKTVAVYSEADRHSLHVRFADEAVCIGPAKSARSYLDIPSVISAAEITNVDAIHPGYGFLSENADFAEVCELSNIRFIGPPPDVTRLMGVKDKARAAMAAAGRAHAARLRRRPDVGGRRRWRSPSEIGYPVILKASAGGGGRGMRIVRDASELPPLFTQAQQEAAGQLLLCRRLPGEVPPCAAAHRVSGSGRQAWQCGSLRRAGMLHPAPPSEAGRGVALAVRQPRTCRQEMSARLRQAMRAVGYTNAGTVEFLMDENGNLYFIEVNARIQVEHPVTEAVTGIDLVKGQILVAAGEPLSSTFPSLRSMPRGHAIECRINAENPDTFAPSPGRITALNLPGGPGVRVDTAAYADCVISPYYDSLIAKLITHGRDRAEAIARMNRALEMFVVEGIHTSIPLHQRILADPDFLAGRFDTTFVNRFLPANNRNAAKR